MSYVLTTARTSIEPDKLTEFSRPSRRAAARQRLTGPDGSNLRTGCTDERAQAGEITGSRSECARLDQHIAKRGGLGRPSEHWQPAATIDELTREHELVLGLVGQVRVAHAGADIARMAGLARQIAAVLGPHAEVEEQGLFPALEAGFPDHIAALRAEHRHVAARTLRYRTRCGMRGCSRQRA